jgi:hypothetical protein
MLEARLSVTMLVSFIVNRLSKFDFSNFDLRMMKFDTSFDTAMHRLVHGTDKRFPIF